MFGFDAHLLSEAAEVSEVRLLHFARDGFLRSADEMSNLTTEMNATD